MSASFKPSDTSERIISLLVFLLVCVPMLIGHHARPMQTFYPELVAFVLGLGLIGTVAWRFGLSFGLILLSPILWVGLIAAQVIAGRTVFSQDLLGFSGFVMWAVLLATAVRQALVHLPQGLIANVFAVGVLAGATCNALAAFLQVSVADFPGIFFPYNTLVVGNIGQRNLFSAYLMLGIFAAIHLHGTNRLQRPAMLGLLVLLTFAVGLAGGRSVMLYTLWLAASALMIPGLLKDRRRMLGIGVAVGLIVFWEILHPWVMTVLPLPNESIADRLRGQGMFDGVRKSLLAVAWQQFLAHPLLGGGLGAFDQFVFWQALPADSATHYLSNVEHAHNLLAHLAAELGIFALLPVGCLVFAWIRRKPVEPEASWWLWVGPGVLFLHALIEYPLWYVHYLGLFACFLAFTVPPGRLSIRPGLVFKVVIVIFSLLALLGLLRVIDDYRKLETYPEARVPPAQIFQAFNEIAKNPLIGQHARAFLAANLNPAPVRIPEKLALCQRSLAEFADEAVILACLPIFDLAGQHELAQAYRERLARNVPRQQPGR